jgi:xanthine phosphoribosyltransferase
LGGMMGYLLDIRNIQTLSVEGYKGRQRLNLVKVLNNPDIATFNVPSTLFIDDISDTGRTMNLVQSLYPNAHRFSLVVKPEGKTFVHFACMIVDQGTWVEFPWEIKEGARQQAFSQEPASPQ